MHPFDLFGIVFVPGGENGYKEKKQKKRKETRSSEATKQPAAIIIVYVRVSSLFCCFMINSDESLPNSSSVPHEIVIGLKGGNGFGMLITGPSGLVITSPSSQKLQKKRKVGSKLGADEEVGASLTEGNIEGAREVLGARLTEGIIDGTTERLGSRLTEGTLEG